jgi:hypothetical protein
MEMQEVSASIAETAVLIGSNTKMILQLKKGVARWSVTPNSTVHFNLVEGETLLVDYDVYLHSNVNDGGTVIIGKVA